MASKIEDISSAGMRATNHIELAPFRTKAGISEQQLLAAIDAMEADLRAFPGFLRRDTVKLDDGSWLDIVHWRNRKEAEQAFELFHTSEPCNAFMALLDGSDCSVTRGERVRVQVAV